jgi:hypothetical protein
MMIVNILRENHENRIISMIKDNKNKTNVIGRALKIIGGVEGS